MVYTLDFDFDGDGSIDLSQSDYEVVGDQVFLTPLELAPVTHTYTIPGVYPATVTINDLNQIDPALDEPGVTFTFPIEVLSVVGMDQMFRGIWATMLNALQQGDTDQALSLIAPMTRDKYERVFDELGPQLPTIAPQFGDMVEGSLIGDNIAEYVVVTEVEEETRGFLIYFIRSFDGVWRLEQW